MNPRRSIPPGFKADETDGKLLIADGTLTDEDCGKLLSGEYERLNRSAGRGELALADLEDGRKCLVRKYYHGGLAGVFTGDRFRSPVRFLSELEVTLEAHEKGVPVPRPLGLLLEKNFFWRGSFLAEYLEDAPDLLTYLDEERNIKKIRAAAAESGKAVRTMHETGIVHADLNGGNILVRGSKVFIVDFDGARTEIGLEEKKRKTNLARLIRSLDKASLKGVPADRTFKRRILLSYFGEDEGRSPRTDRLLRNRFTLHRLWWKIKGEV